MNIWSSSADYCLVSIYTHLSRKSTHTLRLDSVRSPLLSLLRSFLTCYGRIDVPRVVSRLKAGDSAKLPFSHAPMNYEWIFCWDKEFACSDTYRDVSPGLKRTLLLLGTLLETRVDRHISLAYCSSSANECQAVLAKAWWILIFVNPRGRSFSLR